MAAAQTASTKPNIVLVLSDDHSYPYLGCYGTDIQTPNLDRFAKEGMRFNNMYTAAPQCVPSRTAYMTGRSPVAARMGRFSSPLPPDVKTLPEHLRAAGYFTGAGRRNFHLDGPGRTNPVTTRVFEEHHMKTWDTRVDFLDRNAPRAQTVPLVNQFLDKVPQGKPFFLWLNFNDPHHPWDAKAVPDPQDPAKLKMPAQLPDLPGMRADLARYYDEITRADDEFASILGVLEKRGLSKNTLVIFAGDNGMAFPHGKGSLYDPGLHVPMLIRWPGVVKPGSVTDDLISGEDVPPTLMHAAGLSPAKEMSGRSFLGLLKGQSYEPRKYIFAARLPHGNSRFSETTKASTFDLSRCVRSRQWKLIYNCTPQMEYQPVDSARDPGWVETVAAHKAGTLPAPLEKAYFQRPRPVIELYDLQADPSELNNLAGKPEHAAVEMELKQALQEKMILDYDFLPLPLDA